MIRMSAIAPKGIFEEEVEHTEVRTCYFADESADLVYDDYAIPDEAA